MLSAAVDASLAARRAAGFQLRDHEGLLRDFARFAAAKGEAVIRTPTVLEWVRVRGGSPLRCGVRLRTVVHWARFLQAEDDRHEVPPRDAVGRGCQPAHPRQLQPHVQVPVWLRQRSTGEVSLRAVPRPAALEQVRRILAISSKRTEERLVYHLTKEEMRAMLEAPDPRTRSGLRDQAMLYLGFAAGLRVSELVGLRLADLELDGPYPSVLVRGKGRRQRRLPLWKEATRTLRAWLAVRGAAPVPEVFVNRRGEALTGLGFSYLVKKYAHVAMPTGPGRSAKRVSPHVLRHTCAMNSLQATRDIRKVALWLGHSSLRSTEIYLRADPTEKLNTIEAALPPDLRRGVFRVEDHLIAWLSDTNLSGASPRPAPIIDGVAASNSA
jgi:integrase/recombinase XerD